MISDFQPALQETIQRERDKLVGGLPKTYESYRERVGFLAGLEAALVLWAECAAKKEDE